MINSLTHLFTHSLCNYDVTHSIHSVTYERTVALAHSLMADSDMAETTTAPPTAPPTAAGTPHSSLTHS